MTTSAELETRLAALSGPHEANPFAELHIARDAIAALRTAEEELARVRKDGPYWLIEYKPGEREADKRPRWWNGTHWNAHDTQGWTVDANSAIRFLSNSEALVVCMSLHRYPVVRGKILGEPNYKMDYGQVLPTQHEWSDAAIKEHPNDKA